VKCYVHDSHIQLTHDDNVTLLFVNIVHNIFKRNNDENKPVSCSKGYPIVKQCCLRVIKHLSGICITLDNRHNVLFYTGACLGL